MKGKKGKAYEPILPNGIVIEKEQDQVILQSSPLRNSDSFIYRAKPKGLAQAVTAFIRQIRDGRESISTQRGNLSIFEPRIKDIERLKLQR